MQFIKLVTTLWTYVRAGSPYISMPLTVFNSALLSKLVFPSNYIFVIFVGSPFIIFLLIFFGKIHYGKPFQRDNEIAIFQNPYSYKVIGLWKDAVIPTLIYLLEERGDKEILLKKLYALQEGKDIRTIT